MIFKVLKFLIKLSRIPVDVLNVKVLGKYPVFYFDEVPNVGDLINPYLVKRLSNKESHQVRSRSLTHAVCLGSMFHMANSRSVIWGTGVISDSPEFAQRTRFKRVTAVRGCLTARVLKDNGADLGTDPVYGDPGILMPMFYAPDIKPAKNIGIIPHYVDQSSVKMPDDGSVILIDVAQQPERFIDQLLSCRFVISSSLHGLILADSYGIPNQWVSFSDKITGGEFKFHDYYSTTDSPDQECLVIEGANGLTDLVGKVDSIASVKKFRFDKERLIDAFPKL